ncbi:MAG: VTT domain-containing protein, partial [Pseudomonadota bacterium]
YMLLAIAAGGSQLAALLAVASGSLLGGATGYAVARSVGTLPWASRLFGRSSQAAMRIYTAHGTRVILVASLTPVAFSMLCYFAGICRLPPRAFFIIALFRLPKLVAYYYLVRLGWSFV